MSHSPFLGAFIRSSEPLSIRQLEEIYKYTTTVQIEREVERMLAAGHIRGGTFGTFGTMYLVTPKGKQAWHSDDDE